MVAGATQVPRDARKHSCRCTMREGLACPTNTVSSGFSTRQRSEDSPHHTPLVWALGVKHLYPRPLPLLATTDAGVALGMWPCGTWLGCFQKITAS